MKIKLKAVKDISLDERYAMYRLFSSSHELGLADYLKSFDLFDEYAIGYHHDEVVAVSALNTQLIQYNGSYIVSIYIGSSCVSSDYRGHGFIPKISIMAILKAFRRYPFYKKYIWCLAATYKPYMFYSKVVKTSYPRYKQEDSCEVLAIRDALIKYCPANFGQNGWLNQNPVVWRLKDQSCEVKSGDLVDPDIAFYQSFNIQPHYGLFTFAPASLENTVFYYFKNAVVKQIKKVNRMVPVFKGRHY